jgi:hypothetical protein
MNRAMTAHTSALTIRLALLIFLFAVIASAAAALARYNQGLGVMLVKQRSIKANLDQMRSSTVNINQSVAEFRRLLPAGYGTSSPELLMFARMDEIKQTIRPSDISVKPVETKEGVLTVEFSLKLNNPDFSKLVNTLGQLETSIFPFVSIRSVAIEQSSPGLLSGIMVVVEGAVLMPAQTAAKSTAGVKQ